jgi:hypothetical protein
MLSRESVSLGVGMEKLQIRELEFIPAFTRAREHGLRKVNPEDRPAGAHACGQLKRSLSAPTADVKSVFAWLDCRALHDSLSKRADLGVKSLL